MWRFELFVEPKKTNCDGDNALLFLSQVAKSFINLIYATFPFIYLILIEGYMANFCVVSFGLKRFRNPLLEILGLSSKRVHGWNPRSLKMDEKK